MPEKRAELRSVSQIVDEIMAEEKPTRVVALAKELIRVLDKADQDAKVLKFKPEHQRLG